MKRRKKIIVHFERILDTCTDRQTLKSRLFYFQTQEKISRIQLILREQMSERRECLLKALINLLDGCLSYICM